MAKIEQFIYTSSPWGKNGSGWMIFRKSADLAYGIENTVYPFFNYAPPPGFNPDTSDEEKLAKFPVQFVCAKTPDGRRLLSQTCYTGIRWWEHRSGDFWAQVYIMPASVWENCLQTSLPFQWFLSDSLDTRYPDNMRQLAEAVLSGREYKDPPDLPTLDSLDEIRPNSDYDFEEVLGRMSDNGISKLGGILAACVKHIEGTKALVFDATMPESLDMMAIVLALMPLSLRMAAQFSTYFHAANVRETKADENFLFYGTVLADKEADQDTGLYGTMPVGGPAFASREDVTLFKALADAESNELNAKNFDKLVACWELLAGKIAFSPEHLRKIGGFISEVSTSEFREKVFAEVAKLLEESSETPNVDWMECCAVAQFTLGVELEKLCEFVWYQFLLNLLEDAESAKRVFDGLPAWARTNLLSHLAMFSIEHDRQDDFANQLLEINIGKNDHLGVQADISEEAKRLLSLSAKYKDILATLSSGSRKFNESDLKDIKELREIAGNEVKDIDKSLKLLKYYTALARINGVDDIMAHLGFLKTDEEFLNLRKVDDVRHDIIDKVSSPSSKNEPFGQSPEETLKLTDILDSLQLDGKKYLIQCWKDKTRELRESKIKIQTLNDQLEKAQNDARRRHTGKVVAVACIVGFILGMAAVLLPFFFRKKTESILPDPKTAPHIEQFEEPNSAKSIDSPPKKRSSAPRTSVPTKNSGANDGILPPKASGMENASKASSLTDVNNKQQIKAKPTIPTGKISKHKDARKNDID